MRSQARDVLIIEDNPGDIRLMKEALREMSPPVSIHSLEQGDQALDFLRRQGSYQAAPRPKLIFLDFNLPRTDSRDLLRQIKEDEALRVIPVAVLTSSDSQRDILDAYRLHANCYLRKPVDLDSFFELIRSTANFWLNIVHPAI